MKITNKIANEIFGNDWNQHYDSDLNVKTYIRSFDYHVILILRTIDKLVNYNLVDMFLTDMGYWLYYNNKKSLYDSTDEQIKEYYNGWKIGLYI